MFFPDAARELEEGERKKKPNCFALGPVFDNFSRRTYYISCGELLTEVSNKTTSPSAFLR